MTPGSSRPTEADWDLLVGLLRRTGAPVLVAHVSPDADALGSALAVGLALRELGSRPRVTFGDVPLRLPANLSFLPGQELLVSAASLEPAPELVVSFDTSSADRLGVLAGTLAAAGASVAVDHHRSYTGFADAAVLDVTAPATAILALELVDRLGVPLRRDMAACLYAGLVTDTGSFRYAGTTPATHSVAARLLATGIAHDVISRHLWDSAPFGYLDVLGAALRRTVLDRSAVGGRGLAWTTVPCLDRERHGLTLDAVEGVIDSVRKVDAAEVACVLKEDDAGGWRVSLRAKGAVDVGTVAVSLGGGGHRYAAGFTSYEPPRATVARLVALLGNAAGDCAATFDGAATLDGAVLDGAG